MNRNKLTLDSLIAKKIQKNDSKKQYKNYYVKSLDGELVIEKPDRVYALEIMDSMAKDDSVTGVYNICKDVIYNSVKILRDAELQRTYNCGSPDEIIDKLFAIDEVIELGTAIVDWDGDHQQGVRENMQDEIKNS